MISLFTDLYGREMKCNIIYIMLCLFLRHSFSLPHFFQTFKQAEASAPSLLLPIHRGRSVAIDERHLSQSTGPARNSRSTYEVTTNNNTTTPIIILDQCCGGILAVSHIVTDSLKRQHCLMRIRIQFGLMNKIAVLLVGKLFKPKPGGSIFL